MHQNFRDTTCFLHLTHLDIDSGGGGRGKEGAITGKFAKLPIRFAMSV